jgi:PadR family transcriptional regulator PadR
MSIKTQIYKGSLEICILQLIAEGINYGYDLVSQLNERDFDVSPGTVYPILSRLKADELVEVEYHIEENKIPRKIYKLTDKGKKSLREMKAIWFDNVELINKILK